MSDRREGVKKKGKEKEEKSTKGKEVREKKKEK